MFQRFREFLIGKPKDPLDPRIFHRLALAAFFAWVGLGADGLSSSCYGPEEAFLTLGHHTHLAVFLALAVMGTVFLLSASYSQIIELFPNGGGGYMVASTLVGRRAGLVSGSALLVDYVLTIAISLASSMDAIFSFLPSTLYTYKFEVTLVCLVLLIILNLRGIKESVIILTPIFLVFVVTHVFVVIYGIGLHGPEIPHLLQDTVTDARAGVSEFGLWGILLILFRAFALGGGTFTGIEAVSNGVQMLREPRVATGKRTMLYMALSLSFTAGGILICYVLNQVHPVHAQTLNAVLVDKLFGSWHGGKLFYFITLLSEGALLVVAAQTGFLGGPRVMANMAIDSWFPRRFTHLSERLVMKDGILVMGVAALGMVIYAHGSVRILVVMYSINVFITFTLSQLGMVRHWMHTPGPGRSKGLLINSLSLVVTSAILLMTIGLKFMQGGWMTLLITGGLITVCAAIKRHYNATTRELRKLDEILINIPLPEITQVPPKQLEAPTAILMVNGYNGMGIHSILAIQRFFPGHFKNFVFLSAGIIDSDRFRGRTEIKGLEQSCRDDLHKYVRIANQMGFYAESDYALGTDVIEELEQLCRDASRRWEKKVYFTGQLAFEGETFWTRLMHNQTSFALQRKLLFSGMEVVILPIRVRMESTA